MAKKTSPDKQEKVLHTDAEWKMKLSPEQFHILREKGTERPFSGHYDNFFQEGIYLCAGCGAELFGSNAKFNSGCGWPSFDQALSGEGIEYADDNSFGMHRTEIRCSRCGGHLGHVFNDGPTATGMRYCVNSASLKFEQKDTENTGK